MDRDAEKLFALVKDTEPQSDLLLRVNLAVDRAERRRVLSRAAGFAVVSLLAAAVSVTAWRELQTELAQTGFVQFVSLLVSDLGLAATYWKEFSMSILESIPVFGIAAILGSVFALLGSLRLMARDLSRLPHRSPKPIKI